MSKLFKKSLAFCVAIAMVFTLFAGTISVNAEDAEETLTVTLKVKDTKVAEGATEVVLPLDVTCSGDTSINAIHLVITTTAGTVTNVASKEATEDYTLYYNGQYALLNAPDLTGFNTANLLVTVALNEGLDKEEYGITIDCRSDNAADANENALKMSYKTGYILLPFNHVHAYSDTYTYDENNHWKTCECGEKAEEAPHTLEYVNNGDNHTASCSVCGYTVTEDHAYTDNECPCGETEAPEGPVLDKNIKPGTHTISTGETFGLGLRIQLDTLKDEYASYRLDVKRTGYASGFNFAYFETSIYEFSENTKFNALISKVTLYGIELFSTTAPIEYTLHCFDANGVEIAYSETFRTSLADSAIAYHDLPETRVALKKVMADLIQVGAAALNEYTNNRTKDCDYSSLPIPTINSEHISTELPNLSIYDETDGTPAIKVVTGVQDRAYFNLTIDANFKEEADRYHYKVYYQNKASSQEDKTSRHEISSAEMKGSTTTLFCSFKNIPMFATNEEVTFELYKDGILVSTRKYSIDTYISAVLQDNTKKETLKTLLREVAKLGQSFRESRGF